MLSSSQFLSSAAAASRREKRRIEASRLSRDGTSNTLAMEKKREQKASAASRGSSQSPIPYRSPAIRWAHHQSSSGTGARRSPTMPPAAAAAPGRRCPGSVVDDLVEGLDNGPHPGQAQGRHEEGPAPPRAGVVRLHPLLLRTVLGQQPHERQGRRLHDRCEDGELDHSRVVARGDGVVVHLPDAQQQRGDVTGQRARHIAQCGQQRIAHALGARRAEPQVHARDREELHADGQVLAAVVAHGKDVVRDTQRQVPARLQHHLAEGDQGDEQAQPQVDGPPGGVEEEALVQPEPHQRGPHRRGREHAVRKVAEVQAVDEEGAPGCVGHEEHVVQVHKGHGLPHGAQLRHRPQLGQLLLQLRRVCSRHGLLVQLGQEGHHRQQGHGRVQGEHLRDGQAPAPRVAVEQHRAQHRPQNLADVARDVGAGLQAALARAALGAAALHHQRVAHHVRQHVPHAHHQDPRR
mmetsp:Transcript_4732/g.6990  ORF Transcript_4732/g.6990 Transcript_4732/m.6990 type:complete len:463 (+) Transcript_4732:286-1674(+)